MRKIIVAGCGTGVGKTLISAILTCALEGSYWKPIQCGDLENSDSKVVQGLISAGHQIHPSCYDFKAPVSPHYAAKLEGRTIDLEEIIPPVTAKPLIIEMAGGIFVPLNDNNLAVDLFSRWDATWVVVSQNYLGSINHTLLTIQALQQRKVDLRFLVFNGEPNGEGERAILHFSKLPCLGRVLLEKKITSHIVTRYADQWKIQAQQLLT